MARTQAFTEQQVAYLESLPAVDHVTSTRITYAKDFRRRSLARYLHGASPTALFREAGLDPKLVGYKRIERCFARWKEQAEADGTIDDVLAEPDDAYERRDGGTAGDDHGRGGSVPRGANTVTITDRGAAHDDRPTGDGTRHSLDACDHDTKPTHGPIEDDASPAAGAPIPSGSHGKTPSADDASEDPRDLLIEQQARRIAELEQEVRELRDQRR